MSIQCKPGVVFKVLKPEIYGIFAQVDAIFAIAGVDAVITSANDSVHMPTSWHYRDLAIDLRTKHLATEAAKQQVLRKLQVELGAKYQVFYEHPGSDNQHFHIEVAG